MSEINPQRPRIVVGVDGSRGSKSALRWAVRIARAEQASIEVVGAWDFPSVYGRVMPDEYTPKEEARQSVAGAVDEIVDPDLRSDLQMHIGRGHPVRVLLDESAAALMLVVGSRGHG